MKTAVFTLLAASASAQAPDGTDPLDGGLLDAQGYEQFSSFQEATTQYIDCNSSADCPNNTADALDEGELQQSCGIIMIGSEAETRPMCSYTLYCGIEPQSIEIEGESSEDTYTGFCNDAETEETGADLDVADYLYWNNWVNNSLVTCTADADCSATGTVCGTVSLDTLSGDFCIDRAGWCAVKENDDDDYYTIDGAQWDVRGSTNKFTTDCTSDAYLGWLWRQQNEADQDGACALVPDDGEGALECTTISWGGSTVDAFCGTASMKDDDSAYSVIGCYPMADCENLGGSIPDSETIKYELLCGATSLFASAVAASVAIAASI